MALMKPAQLKLNSPADARATPACKSTTFLVVISNECVYDLTMVRHGIVCSIASMLDEAGPA